MSTQIARSTLLVLAPALVLACSGDPTPTQDASVAITLDAIELTHPTLMPVKGREVRFGATGTYSDGTRKDVSAEVTWASSDDTVATIGPSGLAIARAPGTTEISATLEDVTAKVTLTVLQSPVRSINVQPRELELLTGTQHQFNAVATLTDGSSLGITASAVWASTDEAVATVVAGNVTAIGPGLASISAQDAATGINQFAVVTVREPRSVAIVLAPDSDTLELGETLAVTATLRLENDATQDVTAELTWSSNDTDVAEVSDAPGSKGTVTARGPGTASITGRHEASGLEDGMRVTVVPPTLVGIRVTPGTATLELRERQSFSASAVYSDGSERPVTGGITWVSSDETVAEIDTRPGQAGTVQAVGVGTVTISALNPQTGISSDDSGMSATLTVAAPRVTSVIVLPTRSTVAAGLTQQFRAFAVYSDNSGVEITNATTWLSSDPLIATVDALGLVQALSAGTVTISATDPTTNINSEANQTSGYLTVDPPVLLSLAVTPPSAAMVVSSTQQFNALASYSDGVVRDVSTLVTWASSAPAVTVSSSGLATAQSLGQATISVTDPVSGISSADSGQSATVLVAAAQLISIAVTPVGPALPPGATAALSALGTYDNNSTVDLTGIVTWSSSTPAVATVSNANGAKGVVTAVTPSSIIAIEPSSGVSSEATMESATVTVPSGVTLQSIAVTPASSTFNVNQSVPFTAVGTFSDASAHPMTEAVTWSASTGAVVSVSNVEGTRGLVSGVAVGSSRIIAQHAPTGVSSETTNQSGLAIVEQGIEVADVVHYELDEGAGAVATNLAPGQPNGTITGAFTWVPGGGAPGTSTFSLEMAAGSANSINPSLPSAAFTNLTIDYWWRYVSGPSTSLCYMWNSGISFRTFTGGVAGVGLYVRSTPGGTDIVYAPSVQTGAWFHFAYVLDAAAGQGRLYINGVPAGTSAYSGSINITSWLLAGQSGTNGQTGQYDRFRVWSTAQSASEVMDMYLGNR